MTAVRAQGPGGQNVNKVASAVHLRFAIAASSLPEAVKLRLLASGDQRITLEGVLVIKAQSSRSHAHNRREAWARLLEAIAQAAHVPTQRKATRPTRASVQRRLASKAQRAEVKATRGRVQG
jgi:ribosome-associated protein